MLNLLNQKRETVTLQLTTPVCVCRRNFQTASFGKQMKIKEGHDGMTFKQVEGRIIYSYISYFIYSTRNNNMRNQQRDF